MKYNDEFHGHGGSYELDPVTGKRRLLERTTDQNESAAKQTQPQPAPKAQDQAE